MSVLPMQPSRSTGLTVFLVIWAGQLVSLLGTSMTQFALTIWAWEATGEATALSMVGFFSFAPTVLLSPLAGVVADRWNRKALMILSDLGAGMSTLAILVLFAAGRLEVWHLYVTGAFAGAFQAFQFPAYIAAVTTLLPKEHYARASGLLSFAQSASSMVAPLLASILMRTFGLIGILLIDAGTCLAAVVTLLVVAVPRPAPAAVGLKGAADLWRQSFYGFQYIFERPSLLYLQAFFLVFNLIGTFSMMLLSPMILARSGNDEVVLGSVQSALGVGGIVGGLLLGVWGGPKHRIRGVLLGWVLSGMAGNLLFGVGRSMPVWAVAGFFSTFFFTIASGAEQAIWQSKVAPDVQGRVFAGRRLSSQITVPVGMLLAGPLADGVFEPAMMPGGALAGMFGGVMGTGPGAGMALILALTGILELLVCLSGFAAPAVRNIEELLPDYDAVPSGALAS